VKKYRFWLDTETTGLKPELHQILEYAAIIEDEKGVEVERTEMKILLKPFVKPEPKALETNKIDPYSDSWIMESVKEEVAAKNLAELAMKYTVDGIKPSFTAYNALFDKSHVEVMLRRHQLKFEDLFNKNLVDPYSTAKRLVAEGLVKTVMLKRKNGVMAPSVKLIDVAAALNLTGKEEAHRALADTETLRNVTRELYKIAVGKSLYDADPCPHTYEPGKIISIVSESQQFGLKIRPLKVLKNIPSEKKFVVFDLADYEKVGLFGSNIKTVDYENVLDQVETDPAKVAEVDDIYNGNLEYLQARIT
jgi:DNA polymerase III epsilon subunit-like protein